VQKKEETNAKIVIINKRVD